MEDLTGKVCLVTGATSGMGEVTSLALAQRGATVVMVGRNLRKAWDSVGRIKESTGNNVVEAMIYDLSSQKEIRDLAADFLGKYHRLDVLVNNVGAWFSKRQETTDGIESTFALNHLGPFLLTNLLLDTMKASSPARIVNVSSRAHTRVNINFDDIQLKQGYGSGMKAYGQSKLANVLFTYELARRLDGTGVTVNALHPGVVATDFGMNNFPEWLRSSLKSIFGMFALSPDTGAQTAIFLASGPEAANITGKYFIDEKVVDSSPNSYDAGAAARLWKISEEMTGLKSY